MGNSISNTSSSSNSNNDCPITQILFYYSPGTKNIQMNNQFYLRCQCAIKFVETLKNVEYQRKIGIDPPVPVIEILSSNVTLNVIPEGETRGETIIEGVGDEIKVKISETFGENPLTNYSTSHFLFHRDPGFVTFIMLTRDIIVASLAVLLFDNFKFKNKIQNKNLLIPEICDFVTNQDPHYNIKRAGWMIKPLIRLCGHVRWREIFGIEYSRTMILSALSGAKNFWRNKLNFRKSKGLLSVNVPISDSQNIEEEVLTNKEKIKRYFQKYSEDLISKPSETDQEEAMKIWDLLYDNEEEEEEEDLEEGDTKKRKIEGGSKRRKKTRRKKTRRRKTN